MAHYPAKLIRMVRRYLLRTAAGRLLQLAVGGAHEVAGKKCFPGHEATEGEGDSLKASQYLHCRVPRIFTTGLNEMLKRIYS